jgi:hypothetical protein
MIAIKVLTDPLDEWCDWFTWLSIQCWINYQYCRVNPLVASLLVSQLSDTLCVVSLAGSIASPMVSTESTLFTLFSISFGILAVYNHVLCHAGSRGFRVPGWVSRLRQMGILPSMEFHQLHHNPNIENPHRHHWSGLGGPAHYLYEPLYNATGNVMLPMHLLMIVANPVSVTMIQAFRAYQKTVNGC